jgi:hypothetical protein
VARLFFDLLILAAVCKEVLELARQRLVGEGLFLVSALALPLFLGVAPGDAGLAVVVRRPIHHVIRGGVAFVSLLVYWQLQAMAGALWQFGALYAVMVAVYLLGRMLGLAWRAIWFFLGLLLAATLYLHFLGGTL